MNSYSDYYKTSSNKTRVFISFDFDHDEDLKNLLVGQAKNDDSPFEITDMSVKEELSGDWKEKVKTRIKSVDQVIIICGEYTDTATGVSAEVEIAQEEEIPYFLLWGRSDEDCVRPNAAKDEDKIYKWTWDNLKSLLDGNR
jgi:hypothetical protein